MMTATQGLPTSITAERMVLGSILLDPEHYDSTAGAIDPADFSLELHRRIMKRMAALSERGERIDRITVFQELHKHGETDGETLSYLVALDDGLPQLPNIDAYLRIVKEKATLRAAIFACQHIINRCMVAEDGAEEILTAAEATVQKLAEAGAQGRVAWRNPGEVMAEYPGGIGAFLEPQRHATGIPTPWPALTSSTGGMRPGELWVIAGRPSMGKSVVGMQMATEAAKHLQEHQPGEGAAVFSLEMSAESLVYRMLSAKAIRVTNAAKLLSAEGRVDAQRFRGGFLNHDERKRLNGAVGGIQDLSLWIDDTRARTVPAMISALRKLAAKWKPRVIVVDHLTEMNLGPRAESMRVGYSQIVNGLKHIAVDFGATMLLLAQLNRKCEDENRRPQLSDLKETGSIEEVADVVTFIHRWERYQKFRGHAEYHGLAELLLAKQRNGPVGMCNLVFLAAMQRFETACGGEDLQVGGSE